jgi:hypothetical protein
MANKDSKQKKDDFNVNSSVEEVNLDSLILEEENSIIEISEEKTA